ncbi:MAG: DUF2145 domain-containing protein [Terricaulis sp.]
MRRRSFLLAGAAASIAGPAMAQSSGGRQGDSAAVDSGFSSRAPNAHLTPEEALAFAKQVENDLAARQARLALVFRTGRPRSALPEGISYTHGAFWAYVPITTAAGEQVHGYAVYNEYSGDGVTVPRTSSYLHQDFPLDFIRASAVDDVAIIIPSPEMQRRILHIMASPTYEQLHIQSYSLVANPLDARHQNCNEFMLDVIGSAAWETSDYNQIKANLRRHFRPTRVRAGLFERLLGPIADERLRMDDQSGRIVTATYESMAVFMQENGLGQESYVLQRAVAPAA